MASVLWVALLVQLLMLANPGSSVAPGDEEALCENVSSCPNTVLLLQHEGADGLLELSKPSPSPHWSCVGPDGQ